MLAFCLCIFLEFYVYIYILVTNKCFECFYYYVNWSALIDLCKMLQFVWGWFLCVCVGCGKNGGFVCVCKKNEGILLALALDGCWECSNATNMDWGRG